MLRFIVIDVIDCLTLHPKVLGLARSVMVSLIVRFFFLGAVRRTRNSSVPGMPQRQPNLGEHWSWWTFAGSECQ